MTNFKKVYTDEQIAAIAEEVKAGLSINKAAQKHGIPRMSLSDRLKRLGIKTEKKEPTDSELNDLNRVQGKNLILTDENRKLQQQLRVAQKGDATLRVLGEQMKELVQPLAPPYHMWKRQQRGPVKESCVLHMSDGHHDAIVHPHMVQNLERHDFNIAMARAENLVETILDYTQNRLSGYSFETLWILAYGDHTSGEIHQNVINTHYANMMRNSLAIGQLQGQMIRELSAWFPQVRVLYLSGNHGRRKDVAKKDYAHSWDSWDYLIAETARAYCTELAHVEFIIPEAFSAVVEIEGYNFHCEHGDGIKSWAGIPWYGIERRTQRLTALNAAHGRVINYFCIGHFHALGTQAKLKGETVINGAWIGTDPYIFEGLSGYNEPMQLLHGVKSGENRGMSWRLPIKLRRPEEVDGPKRYKVTLAGPEG